MAVRKEVAFFAVFAAFLGWRAWSLFSGGEVAERGSRAGRGGSLEYVAGPVPDASLALASERVALLERDLFDKPRDTAPLPQLALEMPPLESLEVLAPPTAWGPEPHAMGAWLRRPLTFTNVPGLFEADEEDGLSGGSDDLIDDDLAVFVDLEAEGLFEQIEALQRQYDWIVVADMKFGYIKSPDRYELPGNQEPILFLEIDPSTGAPRYPGQEPIRYERDRLTGGFGFAKTPANRIELELRQFSDPLRPPEFENALTFAEECVDLRNEADRALEIAEEMFRRAGAVGTDDVRARLGLARCYELAFRFDDAFTIYRELADGEGSMRPEVWARLADLLARFRLFDRAEDAYLEALARGRTNWEARLRYGRFLNERERFEDALEQLEEALLREPSDPALRPMRVAIRSELARTNVALGNLEEALDLFERTRSADPESDLGLAGLISLAAVMGSDPPADDAVDGPDASFDLLFARGLAGVYAGTWTTAHRDLYAAIDADPFRAGLPLRTLSWMADRTGHPEEALAFVESALESMPGDPWSLYHHGRLLAAADDVGGARERFLAALEHELDAPDVLVQLGALSQAMGEHQAAERYYERALLLDPGRPVVHSMRGFNRLQLGEVDAAGADFRAALDRDPDLASATNGLAWWIYVQGDSTEALSRLAEHVDRRRNAPANDPHRAWAEAQKERILDHSTKEVWTDRFDRVGRIGNGWIQDVGIGADVRLQDDAIRIAGQLDADGRTRFYRELAADRFLALEAEIEVDASSSNVTVGVFVSRESPGRAGDTRVNASIELVRNAVDGVVQVRTIKGGESEAAVVDLKTTTWPVAAPVRLRLERQGEGASDTTITFWLDDVPVLERVPVQALGRSNQPLRFGVFVEGKSGRTVGVSVDDVRVVRRL